MVGGDLELVLLFNRRKKLPDLFISQRDRLAALLANQMMVKTIGQ